MFISAYQSLHITICRFTVAVGHSHGSEISMVKKATREIQVKRKRSNHHNHTGSHSVVKFSERTELFSNQDDPAGKFAPPRTFSAFTSRIIAVGEG